MQRQGMPIRRVGVEHVTGRLWESRPDIRGWVVERSVNGCSLAACQWVQRKERLGDRDDITFASRASQVQHTARETLGRNLIQPQHQSNSPSPCRLPADRKDPVCLLEPAYIRVMVSASGERQDSAAAAKLRTLISAKASLLRQIVAGPRARHPEAGLDLCYVTDNSKYRKSAAEGTLPLC